MWVTFRPALSKKSFPVGRVEDKNASREVGIFFFFPNFNFLKLECTGGEVKKKGWPQVESFYKIKS